ncbi:hypothetical protein KT71_09257 [Congregibacter litoralis KT71]|uniref:DUF4440 domain-containing protein n=1 Tax=Congregibacter litoralis KT71 TaxID=314285 RepID=A4A4T2_9GAMM|nr:hypothetical protein KT71_09257 [Congregibacter litoralis KT71]
MNALRLLFASLMFVSCCTTGADEPSDREILELEARGFMDRYLAVYNRRFGHPERGAKFREELGELVTMPLMIAPPMTKPRVPASVSAFTKNFEAFVNMLDSKKVMRLEWQRVQLQILTPNKILANNVGHGLNAAGEVVYETVSLYLLVRDEGDWKIALFSPYDVKNS